MRTLLASCILAWSVAPAISAQDKPDFSGQWVLVSPINGAANAQTMTVRESFKRESVKGTPMDSPLITLAVERRSNNGVRSEVYTIGTVGGIVGGTAASTGTGTASHSPRTRFSTAWDGDTLVIDIRYAGRPVDAGAESEHKEMWSLDPQGALLLITTDRSPGTEPTTTTLMYRRRP
jgi:hypothetical protein